MNMLQLRSAKFARAIKVPGAYHATSQVVAVEGITLEAIGGALRITNTKLPGEPHTYVNWANVDQWEPLAVVVATADPAPEQSATAAPPKRGPGRPPTISPPR